MRQVGLGILAVSLGTLLVAAPVPAHHSFSATYDSTKQVKLEGTVTKIEWVNPHAYVFISVRDAKGALTNWALEIGNPIDLEREGWKRSSLRAGDVVRIDGNPAKDPAKDQAKRAFARTVILARTGKPLFVMSKKAPAASAEPAPRWPDGRISLGPPAGKKGYWGAASAKALVENTASNVRMNDDGILLNIADAGRVAPFQPWARALYEYRQRNLLKDDPYTRCLPPGGPRQFLTPNGFQFIEQRELGRILVLLGGGDRNWRAIHTDGRPQGTKDDFVLTYYGNSVGRWEGDTLVVDSVGFNERFWISTGGLPHTEALHFVERFTRTNLNTLKYEVTVDDSGAYTKPWTGGWTIQWVAGEEIQEYFCEENAESAFVR